MQPALVAAELVAKANALVSGASACKPREVVERDFASALELWIARYWPRMRGGR